jgi:PTS system nitrogen regulatory IIA component
MEKTLTVSDLAEKLQLSISTIYKYTESYKIPSIKVGNRIRVMEEDFNNYLRSCQNTGTQKDKQNEK